MKAKIEKTRSVVVVLNVPPVGEPPRREYRSDMLPPELHRREYQPGRTIETEIVDVPVSIDDERARMLAQAVLWNGGGFAVPPHWIAIVQQCARLRIPLKEA